MISPPVVQTAISPAPRYMASKQNVYHISSIRRSVLQKNSRLTRLCSAKLQNVMNSFIRKWLSGLIKLHNLAADTFVRSLTFRSAVICAAYKLSISHFALPYNRLRLFERLECAFRRMPTQTSTEGNYPMRFD